MGEELHQHAVPVSTTIMNSIRAYVITTARGVVTLETADVRYDSERRMWIGRKPRLPPEILSGGQALTVGSHRPYDRLDD
jgi:hypothetical protein